jgi:hypothetical protein
MDPPLLTSALDGKEWSGSLPGRFIPVENTQFPLDRNLGRSQSGCGHYGEDKNHLHLPGIEPRPSSL